MVSFTYGSGDGRQHEAAFYFDYSGELAVDNGSQEVEWSRFFLDSAGKSESLSMWHEGGRPLNRVGDDLRIAV